LYQPSNSGGKKLSVSLDQVRILDFTRLLPGPFGTQILADLGADVVKVEDTAAGDYTRNIPPLYKDLSVFFCALNRNKRSMKIDLKKPGASKIINGLISDGGFDVIIEGFRPGVSKRLGIDYETLSNLSPGLIHASLPGFGQGSQKRDFAAHDMNLLALSGIMSITGNQKTGPSVLGIQIDDMASGMYLAIGILAALFDREKTGKGQKVEVSMADAAFALNAINLAGAAKMKKAPGFAQHPLTGAIISYNVYKTKDDRYLSVGAVEPKFWLRACRAFGLDELFDEQFSDAKPGNPPFDKLSKRVGEKSLEEWRNIFSKVDACVEPVLDCLEALDYPHFNQREMVFDYSHPTEGLTTQISQPIRMSRSKIKAQRHAPSHGEQTEEILAEAGFSREEISNLKKSGVI